MKRVIGMDIDGVIADFVRGFTAKGREKFGQTIPVVHTERHMSWDEFPGLGEHEQHMIWEHIRGSSNFWRFLSPCVPVYVFGSLSQISQEFPLYFITKRSLGVNVKQQTEGWLKDHGIANPTVLITGAKGEAAKALGLTHYIDDKAGNAVFTKYNSPETDVYLIDRKYNQFDASNVGTKVKRVQTVEQFLTEVLKGE